MQKLFDKLEVVCEAKLELQPFYLEQVKKTDTIESGLNGLWYNSEITFIYDYFKEGNIDAAKQHCYTCGLLDEYAINKFDSRILDYGMSHIAYALLSDNAELITRYADLANSTYSNEIKRGSIIHAIQLAIKNELDSAYINKLEKLSQMKGESAIQLDVRYFKALIMKDKAGIESAINELLLPKNHKYRNKNKELINDFVSHPALGYAKLAWLKGIEVEVNSPLVPKELLPIKPLDNYETPYEFLKIGD